MKKKEYIEPKMKVVEMESSAILAGSNGFKDGKQSLSGYDERESVVFE